MLFSFLIASVGAGPTNTNGIGQSPSPMPISITNRCGVDGAIDHEFVVTLKPPPPTVEGDLELAALLRPPLNSGGRRLDTKDRLSFLQGWVHQYASMVKVPALAVPQLGSCAFSERAWQLWAALDSQKEAGPLGAQPLPRVLERAASKAADFTAFDHPGTPRTPRATPPAASSRPTPTLPTSCTSSP
eukprot:scaffold92237_cov60-Phaeocystis_antarctica.AAC.2